MWQRFSLMVGTLGLALLCIGCDVEQVDEGRLPDMDVDVSGDPGELPEYEMETANIDVDTERRKVTVPDVDVGTDETTVEVPDIDVDFPNDGINADGLEN